MPYAFRTCRFEMDHEAYLDFLLRHHGELNLPYPFAVKLGFLCGPLFLGQALLAIDEESYEIAGAVGYGYGTGPCDYEDRHICQVEIAFIVPPLRRTTLFAQGLRAMTAAIRADNPEVRQVQFWNAESGGDSDRLFAKLLALPGSARSLSNGLALYMIPFDELAAYSERLR